MISQPNPVEQNLTPALKYMLKPALKPGETILWSRPFSFTKSKQAEEIEVITGYFALIEPQYYGYQMFNLLLKVQTLSPADEERLFEFCRIHRHATWFIKTLGLWDFEIAIEVKTHQELQEVVKELKDKFANIVQRIEFAPIFDTLKYNQYPFSQDLRVWQ